MVDMERASPSAYLEQITGRGTCGGVNLLVKQRARDIQATGQPEYLWDETARCFSEREAKE
jgi:hypothetical protein